MHVQMAGIDSYQRDDVVCIVGDQRVAVPIAAHVREDILDRGEIQVIELDDVVFGTEVENRVLAESGIEDEGVVTLVSEQNVVRTSDQDVIPLPGRKDLVSQTSVEHLITL